MAKTVKQLQAEYAAISEENRKAYDELHGTGTGIYSWQNRYSLLIGKSNLSAKEKAELETLKPRYEKAAAAYNKTQTAKNALKKELEAAKKAETDKKESGAREKSAKSAYDKAKKEFDKAAADQAAGGYKADEKYVSAYQTLETARGEYVKAGGKAPELPAPKVAIPAPKGETGGESKTGEQGTGITSYSDALKYLTDPTNKEALIQAQKFLSKFGYKGNTKGEPDLSFTSALENAAKQYASLPEAWRPASLLDYIANPLGAGATDTGGVGGTQVSLYPTITNEEDGKATINKFFQDKFGRDATPEEFKAAYAAIKADQKKNPQKVVTKTDAKGNKTYERTGGTNTEQFLTDYIAKKPNLAQEAATYEASDAKVLQRQKDKKLYDAEVAKLGNDPEAIAKLNQTTSYGRTIQSMQNKIARIALEAGADIADADLAAYAKEAIDTAIDTDAESLTAFINSKLKFGADKDGAYKGIAGENVNALTKVAAANGVDLQKAFGAQLPDWLNAINKGESIETYKKIIRDVAKIGMPEKITKLMDQGVDLATIYAPYKNIMASTLEINPASIDLNDSTLRSAITADAEMPIYEFERQLRKDNRWEYTNQAKSEVADATKKILQDFGFMG